MRLTGCEAVLAVHVEPFVVDFILLLLRCMPFAFRLSVVNLKSWATTSIYIFYTHFLIATSLLSAVNQTQFSEQLSGGSW